MSQHVTDPTRGRGSNNPNVLDLILSNDEYIIDVENLSPLGRSNHCILTFEILCTIKLNNYTKRKYYKNADFDRMRIEFSKIDWKTKFKDSDTNINRQWEILKTELKLLEEKYVPQKEISNHRKGNFPLNAKTSKLIRHKNRLWKRYMETRDGKKYLEYCKMRDKVRALT